jgi:glycosyltransferase involved in cell wall biosynthesis
MPNRNDIDISIVITAHNEGGLCHRTLRSVRRAMAFAAERGVSAEMVAILDRPDGATRSYFQQQADVRRYEVDFGDSGPSRNSGVRQARGRYISFLDGDDLFSRSWLWKACSAAEQATQPTVWTPQISVLFENEHLVWRHPSSNDPDFRPEQLIDFRHWLAGLLVPREIALRLPFAECHTGSGFGSEDWHWHCEMLAAGVAIQAVEGTTFFRRRRSGSRSAIHIQTHAVYRPTQLFDFSGMRRFGIRLTSPEAEATAEAEPTKPAEQTPPVEVQPPTGMAPVRPRSSLKVFYGSHVQPRLPRSVDLALRRLYFGTFPMGARHWARDLRRTIASTIRVRAHRTLGGAKRVAEAIGAFAMRRGPRSLPRPTTDQHPIAPPVPHAADGLPGWLLEDWKDIHSIEPQIFPARDHLAHVPRVLDYPERPVGAAYIDACRRLGEPWPSHVFLVPWLTTGGSDLTALNYVHTLHEQGWADRIVMLATEDRDSTWVDRLPPGVTFLPMGQLYRHLNYHERKALLVRLLLQMRPRMIHNLNSWIGNEAFVTHGRALAQNSHLLGHVFCYDMTHEGQRVGYPVNHTPRFFDVLSALISDNRTLLDEMQEIYGLDPARMLAHYQPIVLEEMRPPRIASSNGRLKILWAGRLDYQKRVDVLNAIAAACADDDFEIHAYGRHVLDRDTPLPHGPHVTFHGPYDGFESLPAHEFDVFLYTSQWDGLPNVLQEAMVRGLVVVASSAGGVKELIRPGETGYLIEPFDNVQAFVAALRAIDRDRAAAARLVWQGYQRLLEQHSPERFAREVAETPGYRALPLRVDTTAA